MRTVLALMNRNRKLFFKDKGMLFTSMITPVILIVLYATFLAKVFRDSFTAAIPDMITISDKLINGTVAAQLTASLMAVSCITVTFCVNLTMVQDKANGTWKDFNVSPVSKGKIYLGYFLSTVANSLMVNALAFVLCLGYLLKMGWYMNAVDVLWVLFDMILLVLFGSTLSSIISFPVDNTGTAFGCRYNCQRRIWFYMWCLYADFKFWIRSSEGTVLSPEYICHFID